MHESQSRLWENVVGRSRGLWQHYYPKLRAFGSKSESVSILKNFQILERVRLQFRAEFSDVFNRHYFNYPITDINSKLFGQVTSVSGLPRQGQLGFRFHF